MGVSLGGGYEGGRDTIGVGIGGGDGDGDGDGGEGSAFKVDRRVSLFFCSAEAQEILTFVANSTNNDGLL